MRNSDLKDYDMNHREADARTRDVLACAHTARSAGKLGTVHALRAVAQSQTRQPQTRSDSMGRKNVGLGFAAVTSDLTFVAFLRRVSQHLCTRTLGFCTKNRLVNRAGARIGHARRSQCCPYQRACCGAQPGDLPRLICGVRALMSALRAARLSKARFLLSLALEGPPPEDAPKDARHSHDKTSNFGSGTAASRQ
jgi:hypothetical protein